MIKAFPDEPQILLEFAAHDFDDMTKKLKEIKKVAQESGVPIISAMGKFQFMDESWGCNWNPVGQLHHALAICLSAVYCGKAVVMTQENMPTASFMIGVEVFHSTTKYHFTNEALHDDIGELFVEILRGMCDRTDEAGVIVEYKAPKHSHLFDDIEPYMVFPAPTPVKDSFKKLYDSGVVNGLAKNLSQKVDIKIITESDISKQLKLFQHNVDKIEKQFEHLSKKVKNTDIVIEKLEQLKFEFATGGWIGANPSNPPPKGSGYSDSGRLLKEKFPGINTVVKHPCKCDNADDTIHNVIMHLNDCSGHGKSKKNLKLQEIWEEPAWTREQIADWTETLDVNLELKEEV